jgi:hypothetical protein
MNKIKSLIKILSFIFIIFFNNLAGMEVLQTIKELNSLQQSDVHQSGLDCGYFALYNSIQMVDPENKNEHILQKALNDNTQFEGNYILWKEILQQVTFLSANEIDKILNKKSLRLPANQIFVLGDPNLFVALSQAVNSYEKLNELSKIDETLKKFQTQIISLVTKQIPLTIIYRLPNIAHWITYGAKATNGFFQIFFTNSLNKPTVLQEDINIALTKAESDIERATVIQAAKEFNNQKTNLEKISMQNAKIILRLIEDYKKREIKTKQTFQEEKASEELAIKLQQEEVENEHKLEAEMEKLKIEYKKEQDELESLKLIQKLQQEEAAELLRQIQSQQKN